MLKRAAVSAIPALVGLAVFPASAMAAYHPTAIGAPANGILNFGVGDKATGNHVSGSGGSGNLLFQHITGSESGATGTNGSQNHGNGAGANSTGHGAGIFIDRRH
ncbi:MAG TPA: hypothetical protein VE733_07765 [Streptosporangiaceae bacterium]|nr:hypothetical protein [Streptosporangiaceae bacterium]